MRVAKALILATTGLAVLALSGCEKEVKAPREQGVCYFIGHPPGAKEPKFTAVAHDVPDLEHCAVQIYIVRTGLRKTGTAGEVTEGSYQGSFLFVSNSEVRMSQKYDGPQFPLLVKAGDKLVQPGAIEIQDEPLAGKQTVEVPKDLPKKDDQGKIVTKP